MLRLMKAWWNRRYPDWVPEIALRYLPVVEAIRAQPARGAILEVGVNRSGLTTYLPVPVVGVDCVHGNMRSPFVTPVVAKGQALPFQTMAFDCTVCMDTLEHVEASNRNQFLAELMRVTRRRVYVGCPMGRDAEDTDRQLQHEYRVHKGESFPFLDEHLANGLPRLEEVLAVMQAVAQHSGRRVRLHAQPNVNVRVHRLLLRLWMRTDSLSYLFHRAAILLVHVRRWLNVGSCYRQIVVVEFES
ncbi:MAG: class I SAM-dependent methyltransferase [Nitrospirota bacterium]|mgnify:CR=1 FL=1